MNWFKKQDNQDRDKRLNFEIRGRECGPIISLEDAVEDVIADAETVSVRGIAAWRDLLRAMVIAPLKEGLQKGVMHAGDDPRRIFRYPKEVDEPIVVCERCGSDRMHVDGIFQSVGVTSISFNCRNCNYSPSIEFSQDSEARCLARLSESPLMDGEAGAIIKDSKEALEGALELLLTALDDDNGAEGPMICEKYGNYEVTKRVVAALKRIGYHGRLMTNAESVFRQPRPVIEIVSHPEMVRDDHGNWIEKK